MNEAMVIRVSMKHEGSEDLWLLEFNGNVIATAKTFDEIKNLASRYGYAITRYKFMTINMLRDTINLKAPLEDIKRSHESSP